MMEDFPFDYIYKTSWIMNTVFFYKHSKSHFYAVKNLANISAHDKSM